MITLLPLTAALLLAAPAPKPKPKEAPKTSLEGTWEVTSLSTTTGATRTMPAGVKMLAVVKDGQWTFQLATKSGSARTSNTSKIKLDTTKTPAHIDMERTQGTRQIKLLGIYEVTGDKMKLCYGSATTAKAGPMRPTSFTDKTRAFLIYEFKRVTPATK